MLQSCLLCSFVSSQWQADIVTAFEFQLPGFQCMGCHWPDIYGPGQVLCLFNFLISTGIVKLVDIRKRCRTFSAFLNM